MRGMCLIMRFSQLMGDLCKCFRDVIVTNPTAIILKIHTKQQINKN